MIDSILITCSKEVDTPFEVVERKGVGHPDSLADAIAEEASRRYSKYVWETFGAYAHHWLDKVMLLGGEADVNYGKGKITKPFVVIFAGKAVCKVGSEEIPVDKILKEAAAHILESTLYGFIPEYHLQVENRLWDGQGPGQRSSRYRPKDFGDLVSDKFQGGVSNDCNVCCGFAPFSIIEEMVLTAERFFTEKPHRYSDTGTDVKIVGTRRTNEYHLLVNLPFLAFAINDWEHYLIRVNECKKALFEYLEEKFKVSIKLTINPEKDLMRPYLTATGTVADTGDIGAVGRGNRINGLITPYRSMSIEASNGKNPLDHTGKIYGVLANRIAARLYDSFNKPVEVCLTSSKERPLKSPDDVFVKFSTNDPVDEFLVKTIIKDEIENIPNLIQEFIFPGIVQF